MGFEVIDEKLDKILPSLGETLYGNPIFREYFYEEDMPLTAFLSEGMMCGFIKRENGYQLTEKGVELIERLKKKEEFLEQKFKFATEILEGDMMKDRIIGFIFSDRQTIKGLKFLDEVVVNLRFFVKKDFLKKDWIEEIANNAQIRFSTFLAIMAVYINMTAKTLGLLKS